MRSQSSVARLFLRRFFTIPVISERQTIAQYLNNWCTTTAVTRKHRTNIRYEELIRLHVVPTIGKVQLKKLTGQHLQALYAALGKKLKPSTVRQVHAVLHKA